MTNVGKKRGNLFITFLVSTLIFTASVSCGGSTFERSYVSKVNSTVEVAMLAVQESQNYIVYYHTTTRVCKDCERYNDVLKKFAKKWEGVIKVYELDCGQLEKEDGTARGSVMKCSREEDHKLPHVDFYVPPTSKWDKMQNNMALAELKNYDGPPEMEFLERFMYSKLTNYGKTFITSSQLKQYLDEDYVGAKAMVFITELGINPEMKALTAFFVDRLDFAFIHPELDEILEQYGVEKLPGLQILVKDIDTGNWSKPHVYHGNWKYHNLKKFCEQFALEQKRVKPEHSFFDKERMAIEDEKRMEPEEREKAQKERAAKKKWLYELDGNNFMKELSSRKKDIVLVHSYSQKSGKHKTWEVVSRKLRGLVTFYELNPKLQVNEGLVNSEFVGLESPFIALYPPGDIERKRKQRKIYSKDAPFGKMARFVADHTKDPSRSLDMESMRVMITNSIHDYKGACILFHNHPSTLLSFRKIAGNKDYQKFLTFGSFKNPPQEVKESIPTTRYPGMVIFFSDFNEDHEIDLEKYPVRVASYQGSILVKELDTFLEQFISTNAKPKKGNSDTSLENMTKPKQWESCKDNVLCLIAFVDQDGESKASYEEEKESKKKSKERKGSVEVLRRIKGKYGLQENNVNVWYIDGVCHHDMLLDFGIKKEQMPVAIAVWHNRKRWAMLKNDFTFENLDYFMKKSLRGAITQKEYGVDFKMHDRNCAQRRVSYSQYKQQVLEWQARDAKTAINETLSETEEDLKQEALDVTKKQGGKTLKGRKKMASFYED